METTYYIIHFCFVKTNSFHLFIFQTALTCLFRIPNMCRYLYFMLTIYLHSPAYIVRLTTLLVITRTPSNASSSVVYMHIAHVHYSIRYPACNFLFSRSFYITNLWVGLNYCPNSVHFTMFTNFYKYLVLNGTVRSII